MASSHVSKWVSVAALSALFLVIGILAWNCLTKPKIVNSGSRMSKQELARARLAGKSRFLKDMVDDFLETASTADQKNLVFVLNNLKKDRLTKDDLNDDNLFLNSNCPWKTYKKFS